MLAVSVGQDEKSIAEVRSTKGSRRNAFPFRIEPERGQFPENSVHPPNKQRWHVLHEDVAGSKQANNPFILGPEAGSLTIDTDPLPGMRNVLTWEAPGDEVDTPFLSVRGRKGPDVVVSPDVWPVAGEDGSAEWIDLDLPGARQAGPREPEIQAAHPREQ
jgi:hypothetical protein